MERRRIHRLSALSLLCLWSSTPVAPAASGIRNKKEFLPATVAPAPTRLTSSHYNNDVGNVNSRSNNYDLNDDNSSFDFDDSYNSNIYNKFNDYDYRIRYLRQRLLQTTSPPNCLGDISALHGVSVGCTSQDFAILAITNVTAHDEGAYYNATDGLVYEACRGSDDNALIAFNADIKMGGVYDVGLYIALEGNTAVTGSCAVTGMKAGTYTALDPTKSDVVVGNNEGAAGADDCEDVVAAGTVGNYGFDPIPVKCSDADNDGLLDIHIAIGWKVGAGSTYDCNVDSTDKLLLPYSTNSAKCFKTTTPLSFGIHVPQHLTPTSQPSLAPSLAPSDAPSTSRQPSSHPSMQPSISSMPSLKPSASPSISAQPSIAPSISSQPSSSPSSAPSAQPSSSPSISAQPSSSPSSQPSISSMPSLKPSASPSISSEPSMSPSISSQPSDIPSSTPSDQPSSQPSISSQPSSSPSSQPSISAQPSAATAMPSSSPSISQAPSDAPSSTPSISSVPSIAPTISSMPTKAPSSNPTSAPSVSSMPTGAPSGSPTDHFYYPDWTDPSQVCKNDELAPEYMLELQRTNYLYVSKEDCCHEHFWWRIMQCMQNTHTMYYSNGSFCDQQSSFENWQNKYTPASWDTADLYDTLEDCCRNKFWWDINACIISSPKEITFQFSLDINNLLDPSTCQDGDAIANALELAINNGLGDYSDSVVTAIGCVDIEKDSLTGNTICGGCLAGSSYVGDADGSSATQEDATGAITTVNVEATISSSDCTDATCLQSLFEQVTADFSSFVSSGQLSVEIIQVALSSSPPIPELYSVYVDTTDPVIFGELSIPFALSSEGLLSSSYYPDWLSAKKGCSNDAIIMPAYMKDNSEYQFDSLDSCCDKWFTYDPTCKNSDSSSTGSAGSSAPQFYPDWSKSTCASKPDNEFEAWESEKFNTLEECCSEKFSYSFSSCCSLSGVADGCTSIATASVKYLPDYSTSACITKSELSVLPWEVTIATDTATQCCNDHFYWDRNGCCVRSGAC